MSTTIKPGRFVWFEYISSDENKAQAFYGELFHWKTKPLPLPQGSYTMIALGDETMGGYVKTPPGAPAHAHWLPHLQVQNAQETATKIKSLGGKVAKEPFKVGDVGTMAVVTDPLGAAFALWQPNNPPPGSGDYSGKDGGWVWNELYSDDPDRSIAFYRAIGGFEHERMQGGRDAGPDRYDILNSDGKGRAGVMKLSGVPAMWMPYIKVANADATVAQAKKLGATIKNGPESIPNVGRIAVISDPLGAVFGILQPAPGM